jgi:HEPN domain-containing protein
MKKLTEEWIAKAEKDYLVAVRESKAEPLATEAICFHAQQCVEKYMKAILQENEVEFEKYMTLICCLNNARALFLNSKVIEMSWLSYQLMRLMCGIQDLRHQKKRQRNV